MLAYQQWPPGQGIRKRTFELPDQRAIVGKPASVQHFADTLEQCLPVANIGAADMEPLRKCWCIAKYGQVGIHSFALQKIIGLLKNSLNSPTEW
jgi:hypothetical protein